MEIKRSDTQPSGVMASPSAGAASTGFARERGRPRDHRIDVLLGAALLMISSTTYRPMHSPA